MVEDIRIKTSFSRNIKKRKLKARLGAEGVLALIELWIYAAENKSTGDLTGMTREDIAMAADWTGEKDALVDNLLDLGFIEGTEGAYKLHDWADNNGYVAHSKERSEHSRKAAEARWGNAPKCSEQEGALPGASTGIAPSEKANGPLPLPYPSPLPSPLPTPKSKSIGGKAPPPAPVKKKYLDVIFLTEKEHWAMVEKYGLQPTTKAIEILNNAIQSKGYKYKSHYHTLIGWPMKEAQANGNGNGKSGSGISKDIYGDGQPYPQDVICTE